jgi:hypothetical protein
VKFLKTKEDTAMVEMGDPEAVDKCIEMLHGVTVFKNRLQLRPSKQEFLSDSGRPFTLEDGSDSFVDFTSSRNNRFLTREQAAKNRFQPPGKVSVKLMIECTPPPITYYWTGLLILDHSYLVGNLTNSKIAGTKALEPLKS